MIMWLIQDRLTPAGYLLPRPQANRVANSTYCCARLVNSSVRTAFMHALPICGSYDGIHLKEVGGWEHKIW